MTVVPLHAPLALMLAAAPVAAAAAAPEPEPPRPNVVFVLADDLGWAELGSYGQQKIRTPSLDRLASEGMRFTRHYAGSPVCAPSRAVLMTGRHPGRSPIRDNKEVQPEGQWPLPLPELTLAELFGRLGYATAAIGKWGLGPPGSEGDPLRQGFGHFFGYNCQRHAHDHYPAYLYDDARRVATGNAPRSAHQALPAGADPADPKSYAAFSGTAYAPDLVWEKARAFVRDNQARPFFLYLPVTVPHLGLQAPEDSLAEYRGLWPEAPYDGSKSYLPQATPRAAYAAMVSRLDRELGRTLELLRELALDQRTIVVFTSDNGPTFDVGGADPAFFRSAGALRGLKGSVYEGGLRVPLIVRFPGRVAPKSVSDRVTGFEDWLPTLVELVGAPEAVPPAIDGVSFAPTLFGRTQEPRAFLYREFTGYGGQQMVRVGDWKGVRQGLARATQAPPLELYDLASDPSEARDVAARHPDVVARLEAVMAREHTPSPVFAIPAIDPPAERYAAARTRQPLASLLDADEARWADAAAISWGPQELATSFRALWSGDGLAVRFDVTDPSPWHTLTTRDDRLWTEEVVELFLDVGATSRAYAEVEWNPANAVVDLWVDRPANRYDRDWNAAGLESRAFPRRDASGRAIGWTVTSTLPWPALAEKAPAGTALPPRPGDRWRFNVYRIERPNGPREPDEGARYFAWSPTGERSFHVPAAFRELEFR